MSSGGTWPLWVSVSSSLRREGCPRLPGMGVGQHRAEAADEIRVLPEPSGQGASWAASSRAAQAGKEGWLFLPRKTSPPPLPEMGKPLPAIQGHLGVLGDRVVQGDLWAESQMITLGQPPARPILQPTPPPEPHP